MKKTITLFLLIITCTVGSAQQNKTIYDFFGGKSFNNKTIFYRLLFEINDGKVSGYAFTDEQGDQETKSIIEGTFNPKTNRIIFSETRKLITKSRQLFDELCYLNGSVVLNLNPKISRIKGSFTELNAVGQECFSGKIEIISPDSYFRLKEKIEKEQAIAKTTPKVKIPKISTPELITNKTKKIVLPTFHSDEKITIKDDEEITIYWNSDTFTLDIWDEKKEDGDKITIDFNNETILDTYSLLNKKKTIELPLIKGENILIFTANNTGFIANNTARVDLFDASIKHQIITQLKVNKSVAVYLVRH